MSEYHEDWGALPPDVRDLHRALKSLIEEVEAVDWYTQRVALTSDPELRAILDHNREEEVEHACMTLEWLRRRMPGWDENLRRYLFVEGDILHAEREGEAPSVRAESEGMRATRDIGLRSLRGE